MRREITKANIDKYMSVLQDLKFQIESNSYNRVSFLKKNKVGAAFLTLLIDQKVIKNTHNGYVFTLSKIEPIHVRKIINDYRDMMDKYRNKVSNGAPTNNAPKTLAPPAQSKKQNNPVKSNPVVTTHSVKFLWGAFHYTRTIQH